MYLKRLFLYSICISILILFVADQINPLTVISISESENNKGNL